MLTTNKTKKLTIDETRALFKRTAERAYDKMLNSERGQQILKDADNYGILYNLKDRGVNWLDLIDEVKSHQEMEEGAPHATAKHYLRYGRNYSYGL